MSSQSYRIDQYNHETMHLNAETFHRSQATMTHGPPMAFFTGFGRHGQMMTVPFLASAQGAHMHAMYGFPVMVPTQYQPQVALNYAWANPYPRWTEPEPVDMLQELAHSSAFEHARSGSEPTQDDGEAEVPGLLVSEDPSQKIQRIDQDVPDNREPFPGCEHNFVETLNKVMMKTSHRLMALLQNELERLERLDAESASIEEVRNVDSAPGIKLEEKYEENNERNSPTPAGGDEPEERYSMLNKAEREPKTRDEPKNADQITMIGGLEAMGTVAPCRQCSNSLQPHANMSRQFRTHGDGLMRLDSQKVLDSRVLGRAPRFE